MNSRDSPQESLVADPQEPVSDSIVKDTPPKQNAQDPDAVVPPAKLVQIEPALDQPQQNDRIQLAPDDSPSTGPNQAIVASDDAVWGDGGLPDQALLQPSISCLGPPRLLWPVVLSSKSADRLGFKS